MIVDFFKVIATRHLPLLDVSRAEYGRRSMSTGVHLFLLYNTLVLTHAKATEMIDFIEWLNSVLSTGQSRTTRATDRGLGWLSFVRDQVAGLTEVMTHLMALCPSVSKPETSPPRQPTEFARALTILSHYDEILAESVVTDGDYSLMIMQEQDIIELLAFLTRPLPAPRIMRDGFPDYESRDSEYFGSSLEDLRKELHIQSPIIQTDTDSYDDRLAVAANSNLAHVLHLYFTTRHPRQQLCEIKARMNDVRDLILKNYSLDEILPT